MGMYSYFEDENFETLDFEGAKRFINNFIIALCGTPEKEKSEWSNMYSEMINEEDRIITFGSWHDMKLISYWYDYQTIFLEGIAKYLEGEVRWTFENSDEQGYVEFKDGKCIIHTGQTNWQENSPEELMRGENLPEELIKLRAIEKAK